MIFSCNANNTTKGVLIGAGGGAVVGGLIGKAAGNTAAGAIIGAAVGGTAGALIGRKMDKQAAELRRDLENATVERVGEGILITFNQGLLFNVNSYNLSSSMKQNLSDLATTLNKYEDTDILIEGHTDSTGSDDYNYTLSQKRAASVSNYLTIKGISRARLTNVGYGETQPVADNNTESGRSQNRRVEVAIYANKKMKKAAERGEL
jgi:outer membrane protein OmpA-like peptidoglycan-associated protein